MLSVRSMLSVSQQCDKSGLLRCVQRLTCGVLAGHVMCWHAFHTKRPLQMQRSLHGNTRRCQFEDRPHQGMH